MSRGRYPIRWSERRLASLRRSAVAPAPPITFRPRTTQPGGAAGIHRRRIGTSGAKLPRSSVSLHGTHLALRSGALRAYCRAVFNDCRASRRLFANIATPGDRSTARCRLAALASYIRLLYWHHPR